MLHVAIQTEPITEVNPQENGGYHLGLEAQNRGYTVYYYTPDDLFYKTPSVYAKACLVTYLPDEDPSYVLGAEEIINLKEMDVILLRQDPPFDMQYVSTTYLLERLMDDVLIVNNPKTVRDLSEKMPLMDFPDLAPPTLITRDKDEIEKFRAEQGEIIMKPLYSLGGQGIFHLDQNNKNLHSLIEAHKLVSCEPLMVQKFLPEVTDGDKRIVLVEGELIGAMNRRSPVVGQLQVSGFFGGILEEIVLSKRDLEITKAVGAYLKEKDILFAGIDIIGDYLTEINMTTPTERQQFKRIYGINVNKPIWDAIEARIKK
ncbi:MAG: glutathione synthase [Alphaproteobacteria bacterium]